MGKPVAPSRPVKKLCPESEYSKRTDLARAMLDRVREIMPADKRLLLTGGSEYACKTLLRDLPPGIELAGPIHMHVAPYGLAKAYSERGRPRKKGDGELSPHDRLGRKGGNWRRVTVFMYQRSVELQVKVI